MIPLRILRIGKFIETESRIGYQGPEGRMGSYCLVGTVSVWVMKKFWKWIVLMVVPLCECIFFGGDTCPLPGGSCC